MSKNTSSNNINIRRSLRRTKLQKADIDQKGKMNSIINQPVKCLKTPIKSKRNTKSVIPIKFKEKFSYAKKVEVKKFVKEKDSSNKENFLDTESFAQNIGQINIVDLLKSKPTRILSPTKSPTKLPTKSEAKKIKRSRIYDFDALKVPFSHGWKRLIVLRRTISNIKQHSDIYYYSPSGKKFRSLTNIEEEFINPNSVLSAKNFCFNPDIIIGVGEPHEIKKLALQRSKKLKGRQTTTSRKLKSKSSIKKRNSLSSFPELMSRQTTTSRKLKSKSSIRERKSLSSVPICESSEKSFKTVFVVSVLPILAEKVMESAFIFKISENSTDRDFSDSISLYLDTKESTEPETLAVTEDNLEFYKKESTEPDTLSVTEDNLEFYNKESTEPNTLAVTEDKEFYNKESTESDTLTVTEDNLEFYKKESTEPETLIVTEDNLEFYNVYENEDYPPVQSASDEKPQKPPFPLFQIRYEDLSLSDEEIEEAEQLKEN